NTAATTSSLVKIVFRANSQGAAVFTVSGSDVNTGDQLFYPPAAAATVTINPPRSGNANLASLSVDQGQLSPAFNPGTQNYSIQVGMGVDRVVVSAAAADTKAQSVQVSGNTGLKDGANPIRVVVTAENGSTKTYTITANRLGPTPTPEPTPTPPMSVMVDSKPFYVIELPEGVEVPAGFYEAAIEINGQMVTAYKSRHGGLVLLYLSNEGPESGFYFYDAQTGEFYRFAQLTVPGAVYTRIMPDESVVIPDGFVEARITIDGEAFDCWKPYSENGDASAESGIYLLYLLNDKGEKGFYLFQNSTRLIFPYSAVPREPEPTPLPTPTPIPTPTPVPVVETNYSQTANPYFVVTIILASIIVLLSGVLAWLLIRRRGNRPGSGPDDDGGFDDYDEINSEANFIKPPKIRRVEAPHVDDEIDE
ncbi:MAG: cadherin-like beta sandwich domain-containing protein, partial [Clostridiaceae bacterium]|nr:cadherin-like beta sandwich domain-containing protein [Clostridiaceae bacterium]